MNQRSSNLRNKMKAQNLKAVLINNLKNVYYLTNFWGSNGTALVTEERVVLFTDSRYTIHAHATCFPFVEIVETRNELEEAAYRIVQNATLTEQLLQYSNRYRSFDDHVQAAFDESLYIFEREYDYAASFKVISDALEMVEAGVTHRFVTSYEKTREQIRF